MAASADPTLYPPTDSLESPALHHTRRRKNRVKSSMSDVSRLSSIVDSRTEQFVKTQSDPRRRRDSIALSEARSILEDIDPIRDDVSAVSTPHRDMLHDIYIGDENLLWRIVCWLSKISTSPYFLSAAIALSVFFLKIAVGPGRQDIRSSCDFGEREQLWWMAFTRKVRISRWYTLTVDKVPPCSSHRRIPPLSAFYHYILAFIDSPFKATPLARSYTAPVLFKSFSYASAILFWARSWNFTTSDNAYTEKLVGVTILLIQPALLLIDDSRLNSKQITLALFLSCISSIQVDRDVQCAFILALVVSFDRIGVYLVPTIIVYMLGKALWVGGKSGFSFFSRITGTFTVTMFIISVPFLQSLHISLDNVWQIFGWVTNSSHSQRSTMIGLIFNHIKIFPAASSAWTYFTFLFSCSFFLWHPTVFKMGPRSQSALDVDDEKRPSESFPLTRMLLHSFLATGSSVYLHSATIEDFTILLPLLPATLLVATSKPGLPSKDWEWGAFICNIGVFSLWPSLKHSGLSMQYATTLIVWNYAIGYNPFKIEGSFIKFLSLVTYTVMAFLHWVEVVSFKQNISIFESINVTVSSLVLFVCTLWAMQRQVDEWWAAGGLGTKHARNTRKDKQKTLAVAKNQSSMLNPKRSQRSASKNTTTADGTDIRKKRISSQGRYYASSDRISSTPPISRDGARTPPALSPTLPQMIASSISNPSTPIDKSYKRHSVIPPLPQMPYSFQSDNPDGHPVLANPVPRNNTRSISPSISRDAERHITSANVKKGRRISTMSYDPSYYRSLE